MTLAFQCEKWDWLAFEEEISAYLMNGWRQWFRRRPQGQFHNDQMLAGLGAAFATIQGCTDITTDDFMHGYPAPPPEKIPQAQIDATVMWLAARQPPKPIPEPEQPCQTSATSSTT